jgi:ADP-heptose:LPS heptosyltransferase
MSDPFEPGLLARLPEAPRKIALLRASRIGDFLCAVPAFRALRRALPDAEIAMITLPMLRDLALRSPHFDRVIEFPGFPGIAEQFFDARRTTLFFQEMQEEHFDLAVQMQGSGVNSNPFTLLLGAKATAGFVREGDPAGRLAAALPYPRNVHEVRCVLALTSFLGVPEQGEELEFPLWRADHEEAAALLQGTVPPLIGLHAAARDATRRWPLERFAKAARDLRSRYGGTIVILGEPEEQVNGAELERQVGVPSLNLVGKTALVTLGAVIARLSLLITNDTGPAHIAYALRTPTVTIFGAGNPATNGPLQDGPYRILAHPVPCRPCGYMLCPIGYPCLNGATVPQVVAAAQEIIKLPSVS